MNETKVLRTGASVFFVTAVFAASALVASIGCAKKESSPAPGDAAPVTAESKSSVTPAASNSPSDSKADPKTAEENAEPPITAKPAPLVCAAESKWRHERIPFPPQFAPTLGSGSEDLFFAEGMFDAKTPSYWSYVFSIVLDSSLNNEVPTDKAGLERFFIDYYAGLIAGVAKGKSLAFDPSMLKVRLTDKKLDLAQVAIEIDLIDAFTDGRKLTVKLAAVVNTKDNCLNVIASPADSSKPIWKRLEAARSCVLCPRP